MTTAVSAGVAGRLDAREEQLMMEDVASVMKALVSEAVSPLRARITELEARGPRLAMAESASGASVAERATGQPTDAEPSLDDDDPVLARSAEYLGGELSAGFRALPKALRKPVADAVLAVAGEMLGHVRALRTRVAALETAAPPTPASEESAAIEARIAALEARPPHTMDYRGLWSAGHYPAGAFGHARRLAVAGQAGHRGQARHVG